MCVRRALEAKYSLNNRLNKLYCFQASLCNWPAIDIADRPQPGFCQGESCIVAIFT